MGLSRCTCSIRCHTTYFQRHIIRTFVIDLTWEVPNGSQQVHLLSQISPGVNISLLIIPQIIEHIISVLVFSPVLLLYRVRQCTWGKR